MRGGHPSHSHCLTVTAMLGRSHFSVWNSTGSVKFIDGSHKYTYTYNWNKQLYTDCTKLQSRKSCCFKLWYKGFLSRGNFQDSKNHQKTMTKKLTITEVTLSGIPARTHTSLPGETDSIGEKRKIKKEDDKGKEKLQKKRTSQKRLYVTENNIA